MTVASVDNTVAGAGPVRTALLWVKERIQRAMGGINLNSGAISLGNVIGAVAIAALVWFGSTMTSDHEQIIKILDGQAEVARGQADLGQKVDGLSGLMGGFQRDLAEQRARLDCIQHVGTVAGCDTSAAPRGRR